MTRQVSTKKLEKRQDLHSKSKVGPFPIGGQPSEFRLNRGPALVAFVKKASDFVVTRLAKRNVIVELSEENFISLIGSDVIDNCGRHSARVAPWILFQES